MIDKLLSKKSIQTSLEKSAASIFKKYGALLVVLLAILWALGRFNIISLPPVLSEALGLDRQNSTSVESIVTGKLESRAILAESTREYTGNVIFEREGGLLNCAGESQRIKDGKATARSTVSAKELVYSDTDNGRIAITVPEAILADVSLDENLEIANKRNPCVRLVQIIGDTTSENEVRTLLNDEITEVAKADTELFTSAECSALNELKVILENAGTDTSNIDFSVASKDRPLNECEA